MPSSNSSASSTTSSELGSTRVRELSETSDNSSVTYSTEKRTETSRDAISIATTSNTGFTRGSTMQSVASSGTIPVIPAPAFQGAQGSLSVNVAHQQQQSFAPSEISPSSGSTISTSGQSVSTYNGTTTNSQANFSYPRASTSASTTYAPSQAYNPYQQSVQYVQPDFTSYSGQYSYAAEASMDSTLYIDYGAIDAYNYAMQAPEVVPNIPQKGKGSALDIKQTIFNQVDRNHDGSISRDEFLQWSQAGQQGRNVQGAAAYTNNQQSYAQSSFVNNNDSNLDITSILQQSGLTQPTNRWQ